MESGYDLFIGRKPIYGVEFVYGKPSGIFVFQKCWLSAFERTEIAVHDEVEPGVVILYSAEPVSNCYLGGKFFTYLPSQCLGGLFSGFHLSAGEFPPAFPFAISALCGKCKAVTLDDGGYHFYCLFALASLCNIGD